MVKLGALSLLAALAALPAYACGVMETAEPRVGSTVPAPERLLLHFSQPVSPAASHVIIADAAGTHSKTGPLASIDNGKALSLTTPALKAGTYKVTWNVLWVDCDSKSKGSYSFTIE